MVQLKQEEIVEIGEEKENTFKEMLFWVGRNLKFLLLPGSRLEELSLREFEYEKTISKRKFIRRLKSVLTILGILIIFLVITLAVFGTWLAPYTFDVANGVLLNPWSMPTPENLLGTTKFGRDILSRIIYGARSSITIALPAITFSVILGVIIGVISGFYRGWVDTVIMRIMDVFLAFPGIILALVFIAILGQEMQYIMLAYGILGIPYYARLIRGSVLQARQLPYIDAAKVAGAGNWRIMFKHVLPNCIQPIIISFTFDIGGIILSLAGLSFLGFSDYRLIEWGNDINIARERLWDITKFPHAAFWPGFMILITVLGFMLVGDGLRDALDPRLKNL
jgi:peptide/nickel transport system permease protein